MEFRKPTNAEKKYIRTIVPSKSIRLMETCTSAFIITLMLSLLLYFILLICARSIPVVDRLVLIIFASCVGYILFFLRMLSMINNRDKHINILRNGDFLVTSCIYDYMYDENKISVKTDIGSRLIAITSTLGGFGVENYPKGTNILICKIPELEQNYIVPTEEEVNSSVEK